MQITKIQIFDPTFTLTPDNVKIRLDELLSADQFLRDCFPEFVKQLEWIVMNMDDCINFATGNYGEIIESLKKNDKIRVTRIQDSTSPLQSAQMFSVFSLSRLEMLAISTPMPIAEIRKYLAGYFHAVFLQTEVEGVNKLVDTAFVDIMKRAQNLTNTHSPIVKKAIEYIKKNINTLIMVQDIADYCKVSSSYLTRIFKQETSISIMKYIALLKVMHSMRYLYSTNMPMKEIAQKTAFSSQKSYIDHFKYFLNSTPTEFRNSKRAVSYYLKRLKGYYNE